MRPGTPPPGSGISGDARKSRPSDQQAMTLFQRMGGINAVKALVEEFYSRIEADVRVQGFFTAISLAHLKRHQVEFLKIAFSHVPESLNVPNLLLEKHKRLFVEMGLNERHFDVVVGHFFTACRIHKVEQSLIDEAKAILEPLRSVFVRGARTYGEKRNPPEQSPKSPVKSLTKSLAKSLSKSPTKSPTKSLNKSPTKSPAKSPTRRILDALKLPRINHKDSNRVEL